MNNQEQTLIDGLFSRLRQADKDSTPRDAQAEALIKEHLARQPAAGYFMTQAILVQEAALKSLGEQNQQLTQQVQQLQAELRQASSQPSAAPTGGGFLSSLFGASREPAPSPQPSSSGGWREPARAAPVSPPAQNYAASAPPAPTAPAMGSGFLGGALKTAAGVAGGVMLAQGISSLFHGNSRPEEIVEVIEPAPAQWANDAQRLADRDNGGNNDQSGFGDSDYGSDDSGLFSDDDFV